MTYRDLDPRFLYDIDQFCIKYELGLQLQGPRDELVDLILSRLKDDSYIADYFKEQLEDAFEAEKEEFEVNTYDRIAHDKWAEGFDAGEEAAKEQFRKDYNEQTNKEIKEAYKRGFTRGYKLGIDWQPPDPDFPELQNL